MMAIFLRDELQNRGVFSIGGTEREKIMAKVLERSSEVARPDRAPRRKVDIMPEQILVVACVQTRRTKSAVAHIAVLKKAFVLGGAVKAFAA